MTAALFDWLLDCIPLGLLFVDRELKIVARNTRAAQAFGGQLMMSDSVACNNPREQEALRALVQSSTGGLIALQRDDRSPVEVQVVPVPKGLLMGTTACAVLAIRDSKVPAHVMQEELRSLYQLTIAEARLAELMVRGHTVREVSTALSISQETTRSQLKNIFAKTNTRRQVELVLLLGCCRLRPFPPENSR